MQAAALTDATAAAAPDPLTLCVGLGLDLCFCRDLSHRSGILNPRRQSRNSEKWFYHRSLYDRAEEQEPHTERRVIFHGRALDHGASRPSEACPYLAGSEDPLLSGRTTGPTHRPPAPPNMHTPVGVLVVNSGSKWKVSSGLPTAGLKGGLISFLYSFCGEADGR